MTLTDTTVTTETAPADFEANTFTFRVEESWMPPFRVRDLFPFVSADSAGIDFDAAGKAPARPRPVPEPTPLRDFVVARLAELPDSPLLAGALRRTACPGCAVRRPPRLPRAPRVVGLLVRVSQARP